jgi:hypothetical protein
MYDKLLILWGISRPVAHGVLELAGAVLYGLVFLI